MEENKRLKELEDKVALLESKVAQFSKYIDARKDNQLMFPLDRTSTDIIKRALI